jgi:hypothetical protein
MRSVSKTMIDKNNQVSFCHIGFMRKMARLRMKTMILKQLAITAPTAPHGCHP